MKEKIKVLVVDDSALMRKLVSNILTKDPEIEVADTAINGLFALKKIKKSKIDIILLDIEMPGMNGLEFLKMRKDLGIEIPVVMLSSLGATKPEVTIQALDLGAKDFIIKPSGSISMDIETVAHEITAAIKKYGGEKYHTPLDEKRIDEQLKTMVEKNIRPKAAERNLIPKEAVTENVTTGKLIHESLEKRLKAIDMILIGISTGGPAALRELFPKIHNKKYPILVVQHMPPGFTYEFAKGLDRISKLVVKEASNDEEIKKGCVYIAPGDKHLSFQQKGMKSYVQLLDSGPVNGHRPSADVLFDTAKKEGRRVVGILMTGMGKDGAKALNALHQEGNPTIAQSPKDCVVFGMPRVAIELGGVDKILDIEDIAEFINSI